MPRQTESAADLIARQDGTMQVILGELVENASKVHQLWASARAAVIEDSDRALTLLIEAQMLLENHVRLERSDGLRLIRTAVDRLDAELPEEAGST